MSLADAWRILDVPPGVKKGELKAAFRKKIREVHPDVTGDDGEMLQKVRDAFAVAASMNAPNEWDSQLEDGLPTWATGALAGVKWTKDCSSFADFLKKADAKALAVGEINEATGLRHWGASWGKYSQEEANAEALRVCRQHGVKCKLVYVGSGQQRKNGASTNLYQSKAESTWWSENFANNGEQGGFGWVPLIDATTEKLIGYKTVEAGSYLGSEVRVRVPVFRLKTGGLPYYYTPLKPKERTYLRQGAQRKFRHIKPLHQVNVKTDPRFQNLANTQDEIFARAWGSKS